MDSWQVDRRNYDTVMLYVVEKLFSTVDHIKLLALCVYFKGFIAKNYTITEDKFIQRKLALAVYFLLEDYRLSRLTFLLAAPPADYTARWERHNVWLAGQLIAVWHILVTNVVVCEHCV